MIIEDKPERVGHAVFLNEDLQKLLQDAKIPLEVCLTSNIKTKSVSSYSKHHFWDLHQLNYPVILCVRKLKRV
jgi:adenosine deaminase